MTTAHDLQGPRVRCGNTERGLHADERPELRVLQVFSSLGVGGAEQWLLAVLGELAAIGHTLPYRVRIHICLTGGKPATLDHEARRLGAELVYLHYSRRSLLRFVRGYRRLLRTGRYHAIHDHQDHSAGWRLLIGLGINPPIRAVHIHNTGYTKRAYEISRLRTATASAGFQLVRKFATHVLGTSTQVLNEQGFSRGALADGGRVMPLYCGFDVSRFAGERKAERVKLLAAAGWTEPAKVILFVGRLDGSDDPKVNLKNPAFAIEVIAACIRRDPEVRALFVGQQGAVGTRLEQYVAELGLTPHIRFLGARSEVPHFMIGSDLLLFPSIAEGLGMVAVEAQACGLRVLASDAVPAEGIVVPELMYRLPLGDGPERWSEVAQGLLSQTAPDRRAANEAVRRSRFSISKSTEHLLRLYNGQA
jgi:glycosyltransferase involved in cell wall biosynthesis